MERKYSQLRCLFPKAQQRHEPLWLCGTVWTCNPAQRMNSIRHSGADPNQNFPGASQSTRWVPHWGMHTWPLVPCSEMSLLFMDSTPEVTLTLRIPLSGLTIIFSDLPGWLTQGRHATHAHLNQAQSAGWKLGRPTQERKAPPSSQTGKVEHCEQHCSL